MEMSSARAWPSCTKLMKSGIVAMIAKGMKTVMMEKGPKVTGWAAGLRNCIGCINLTLIWMGARNMRIKLLEKPMRISMAIIPYLFRNKIDPMHRKSLI